MLNVQSPASLVVTLLEIPPCQTPMCGVKSTIDILTSGTENREKGNSAKGKEEQKPVTTARRRAVSLHPHFGCQARIEPNVWPTLTHFEVPRNSMQTPLHWGSAPRHVRVPRSRNFSDCLRSSVKIGRRGESIKNSSYGCFCMQCLPKMAGVPAKMSTRENVHQSILRQRILIRRQYSPAKRSRENVHQPNLLLSFDCRSDWGCVYTYPDIRISGYPDVRDPDIFGESTRVGSKRFRRLHVSRHPDAIYAAYSLCVGKIRKCFFFLVKVHAFKLSSIFSFLFVYVYWLDDKPGQRFVWQVLLSTIKHSVIWHVTTTNWSCQCMWNGFQNWPSFVETFNSDCAFQDKKRAKELFWSLRKQGKNRFQVEENRRAHA